jgi:glycosyltransferase involved in cell wall biosynthesis
MVASKQLPLLIDALAQWDQCPLEWVHIGGGDDEEAVTAYAIKKLDGNPLVTYQLKGSISPERVRGLYQRKPFDVFINVSQNDGMPVAIIEAMHEGIPVIAPRTGGIPEMVDDSIGCLFDKNGGVDEIISALRTIYEKTEEETDRMRAAAQMRWNERCSIDHLMPEIFPDEAQMDITQ